MDLGNLEVHLKADSTGVVNAFNTWIKAIEEVGKSSTALSSSLKNLNKAEEETEKKVSALTATLQGLSKAFVAVKMGADIASQGFTLAGKAVSVFLFPLRLAYQGITAITAVLVPLAKSVVKTAGDFEFFHKKMETLISDSGKVKKAWEESIGLAGFFDVEQMMDARLKLERVGITGKDAMLAVRDAAVMLGESIEEVSTSVVRMSAGTLRGLRLMGVDFVVEGSKYWFQYRDQAGKIITDTVVGVQAAQIKILEIFKTMFGGAYENVKNTLPVLTKTMITQYSLLKAAFGTGVMPAVVKTMQSIIQGMKDLMPQAEEFGKKLGAGLEKARQIIMEIAAKGLELLKSTAAAFEKKGIGFVIVNAFEMGVEILIKGFVAALEVTWSIWEAIGTAIGMSFLHVLANSGIIGLEQLGQVGVKKNISSALSPLSQEQLQGQAKGLGLETEKYDKYSFEIRKINKTKQELQDAISDALKGRPKQEIDAWFAELSKTVNQNIGVNAGTLVTKAGAEVVKSIRAVMKEFGISAEEVVADFNAKMYESVVNQQVAELKKKQMQQLTGGIEDVWNDLNLPMGGPTKQLAEAKGLTEPVEDPHAVATLQAQRMTDNALRALKQETSLIGKSNREREHAIRMMQEMELIESHYGNILDENGAKLSKESKQYKALKGFAKEMADLGREKLDIFEKELENLKDQERSIQALHMAIDNWIDDSTDLWTNLGDAATGALTEISNGITQMLIQGEWSFKQFARGVMVQLLQMIVQMIIAKALMAGLGFMGFGQPAAGGSTGGSTGGGAASGAMGSGNYDINTAGGFDASSFSADMQPMMAKGGAFSMGNIIPFASGGLLWGSKRMDQLESFNDKRMGMMMGTGKQFARQLPSYVGSGLGGFKPFASGGVVHQPVLFPMAGGNAGLMGEAGPEAIMPLSRGADGSLGVRAVGGGQRESAPPTINNIKIINVQDKAEILAAMTGPAGDKTIINAIKRNKGIVSGVLR